MDYFLFREWEFCENTKKKITKLLVNVVHSAMQLLIAVKNDGKAIKHCVIVSILCYTLLISRLN